jgi:hypothetical protein
MSILRRARELTSSEEAARYRRAAADFLDGLFAQITTAGEIVQALTS